MKKIIVDTNIYSDAMRGIERAKKYFQQYEIILFSPIVIGELLNGFKRGNQEKQNKRQLNEILSKDRTLNLHITDETAEFYAHILHQLKIDGSPIPTNDIWIAASAMENGAAIATKDEHFKKIKGIIIAN